MNRRTIIFSNYDDLSNPYYGGGGARAIHEVAKRLGGSGDVTVLTGRYPGAKDEDREGVQYCRIGPERAGPQLSQLVFQVCLLREVRRRRFDIWVESLTPPFSTACLPLFTSRPVVALTQVMAGRAMSRKYKLPFHLVERTGLRFYRYAIALSEYLASEIRQANPRAEVVVIPNGVPKDLVSLSVQRTEKHWLFLGRIDVEQKGLDLLLGALSYLGDRATLPVVIAGSGTASAEAHLDRLISEHGLGERVRRVGRVAGAMKHQLLSEASLLLMPSRFEASPVVLAEACCYGLPTVLFGVPELSELPDSICHKVDPFDVSAYGEALLDLERNGAVRQRMSLAAKQYAQALDWDILAGKYGEFLGRILDSQKAAQD